MCISTLSKGKSLKSVCTKVAQQMNTKAGGVLWTLAKPIPLEKTIVIGISVTRGKKGCAHLKYHHSRSFIVFARGTAVGFVATWKQNYRYTKYYVRAAVQSGSERIVSIYLNRASKQVN
jgi:hypothetical protein